MENNPKTQIAKENSVPLIKLEKNLIEIGYFSVPTFKTKSLTSKKVLRIPARNNRIEQTVTISASPDFGLPSVTDLTFYLAFLSLLQERRTDIKQLIGVKIPFTSYELLKEAGLTQHSRLREILSAWMLRLKSTDVYTAATYEDKKVKLRDLEAKQLFNYVRLRGAELEDGKKADTNEIELSGWAIENMTEGMPIPVDFGTYKELRIPTARMLVPHLQYWLFASEQRERFEKRYTDFCALLGILERPSPSLITQQLEPAMKELETHQYISDWNVVTDKYTPTKITIKHGPKYFRDKRSFALLKGTLRDHPYEITGLSGLYDNPAEIEAYEKLVGKGIGQDKARELISCHPVERLLDGINYVEFLNETQPGKIYNPGAYLTKSLENPESVFPSLSELYFLRSKGLPEKKKNYVDPPSFEYQGEDEESTKDKDSQDAKKVEAYQRFALSKFDMSEAELTRLENSYEEGRKIFDSIWEQANDKLNRQIYDAWFAPVTYVCYDPCTSTLLLAASEVNKDWLLNYYGSFIESVKKNADVNATLKFLNKDLCSLTADKGFDAGLIKTILAIDSISAEHPYSRFEPAN